MVDLIVFNIILNLLLNEIASRRAYIDSKIDSIRNYQVALGVFEVIIPGESPVVRVLSNIQPIHLLFQHKLRYNSSRVL